MEAPLRADQVYTIRMLGDSQNRRCSRRGFERRMTYIHLLASSGETRSEFEPDCLDLPQVALDEQSRSTVGLLRRSAFRLTNSTRAPLNSHHAM